jgi:hypothetical protein
MSFYNMLFGMNPQADLLLALLGLKKHDVERFRDVHTDGEMIEIYSRTGGGNREGYPNLVMRKLAMWRGSVDDEYDSTYCTDTFAIPEEWREDVKNLSDVLTHGMRREFAEHLAKTLRREPTEDDKAVAAYEAEQRELARTAHFVANGHTFVPQDDSAMRTALDIAEKNGGKLRSRWGIMPLQLRVKRDFYPYPSAPREDDRKHFVRLEIGYDYGWKIDIPYWEHCEKRFATQFPNAMNVIRAAVVQHLQRETAR